MKVGKTNQTSNDDNEREKFKKARDAVGVRRTPWTDHL